MAFTRKHVDNSWPMLVSKKGTVDGRDPINQLIGSLSRYQQYQSHVLLVNTETSFPTIRCTSLDRWILHHRKDVWNHIPTIKSTYCFYTPTCSYQPTVFRFEKCQHMSCHVPFSVPKSKKPGPYISLGPKAVILQSPCPFSSHTFEHPSYHPEI